MPLHAADDNHTNRAAPTAPRHNISDAITPSESSETIATETQSKKLPTSTCVDLDVEDPQPRHSPSGLRRQWNKAEGRLPKPVVQHTHTAWKWLKGPETRTRYHIKPLLEPVQTFAVRQLDRLPYWSRACLYGVTFIIWIVIFAVVVDRFSLPKNIGGLGAPLQLSCTTNLW